MEDKALEQMLGDIGNNLYELRHKRRDKIITVANSVGVSHPVISQIENGRYKCLSLELLCKLANYYSVPIAFLLNIEIISNNL